MPDYSNSKIYKIWSPKGDKIYIGSTTQLYLSSRMSKHMSDYKRWKQGLTWKVYSFDLFDEYGPENCFIELLELKPCSVKDELHKLEGEYIQKMECVNKAVTGTGRLGSKKLYYQNHKKNINVKQKVYHTCECGCEYQTSNKARHMKSEKHKKLMANI